MSERKLNGYHVALMAFVSIWGFSNVVNNYANQGLAVVFSWVVIISVYFVPYTMMVGTLGATFQDQKGGVSSWIKAVSGPKLAYFSAWTYWAVHIPYLAQKPQFLIIALGWIGSPDGKWVDRFSPLVVNLMCLFLFLLFMWIASRGVSSLKRIGTVAGVAVFTMSILYILLMISAPYLREIPIASASFTWRSFFPEFNFAYLTTLSMVIFAIGGAEKVAPYVGNTRNPTKEFPKGMLVLAGMVAVCALLGSVAMGFMFDANHMPSDLKMNGQYYAFQKLGEYYGLGNIFLYCYAIANALAQMSSLAFSIDAPLKVLLSDADDRFIPHILQKTNRHDAPIYGYVLTGILVSILIIVPALGIGSMNALYEWLLDLNAIVMPIRYLWVFIAYLLLVHTIKKKLMGIWCLLLTAFTCILGCVPKIEAFTDEWYFQLILNLLTPVFLLGLGLVFPLFANRKKR